MTNSDLTICINAYKEGKIGDNTILQVFRKFTENLLVHKKADINKEIIESTAVMCFSKLSKFDESRGKAFNFFTTIILCFVRQLRGLNDNQS